MFGGYSKRNVLPVFQVFDDKLSGGKLTEVQDCEDGTFTIKIEFPVTESNKSIAMEMVDQEVWQFIYTRCPKKKETNILLRE